MIATRAEKIMLTKVKPVQFQAKFGDREAVAGTWPEINAVLARWAYRVTGPAGKDVIYRVIFADGFIFSGAFPLRNYHKNGAHLERHIQNHCRYFSGRETKPGVSITQYETHLSKVADDTKEMCAHVLDTYDLGPVSPTYQQADGDKESGGNQPVQYRRRIKAVPRRREPDHGRDGGG